MAPAIQPEKSGEPQVVKTFHWTRVESQRLRRDHQVPARQSRALCGPFEHSLPANGRDPNNFPWMQRAQNSPFDYAENAKPALNEKPFPELRFLLVFGDLLLGKASRAHPCQVTYGSGWPRSNVCDSYYQRGCRFRRTLTEAQARGFLELCRRFNPIEPVGLNVEAGGGKARRIHNFFPRVARDFDRVKSADGSSLANGIQEDARVRIHVVITTYLCCECNMPIWGGVCGSRISHAASGSG